MTTEYVSIATFPKDFNVSTLLMYLTESGVDYRLEEVASTLILQVAQGQAADVSRFIQNLRAGEDAAQVNRGEKVLHNLLRLYPVTITILTLGFLGYFLCRFDPHMEYMSWFTFVDYEWAGQSRVLPYSFSESQLASGQLWRSLTPAFLHFGFLHILLNGLAMWELGRRLELFFGPKQYLLLFLAVALLSNYIEYFISKTPLFGGLSGAVFGYVGLLAALNKRVSAPVLRLPKGLYVMVVVWALIGLSGIINKVFGIQMANGAHIGGLLSGLVIGWFLPLKKTHKSSNEQHT